MSPFGTACAVPFGAARFKARRKASQIRIGSNVSERVGPLFGRFEVEVPEATGDTQPGGSLNRQRLQADIL